MGISLFSALGNLGAQWGQAKEELTQESLRTQQLAAQMKRQDAMQQLAQQRLTAEQTRIDLEKQRATSEETYRKQQRQQWEQAGWEKPLVFKTADGRRLQMNVRTGMTQDAMPGQMTPEEELKAKREPVGYQFEKIGPKGEIVGFSKDDPTQFKRTGQYATPTAAATAAAAAPGQVAQTASDAADMVLKGMPFGQVTSNLGKGGKQAVLHELLQRGYIPPTAATKTNQDAVSNLLGLTPTVDSLAGALSQPDPAHPGQPLYQNNDKKMILKTAAEWFQYNTLHMSPDDPLIQAIIPLSSFVTVQGAAPWTRIGRGRYIYDFIRQHLPDPTRYTPQGMWIRVQQIQLMLAQQLPLLRRETYGGVRQPDGTVKPIGEFDPYAIEGMPQKGAVPGGEGPLPDPMPLVPRLAPSH